MNFAKSRARYLLYLALALPASAQTLTRSNVATILGFENSTLPGGVPAGWTGDAGAVFSDSQIVHSGYYSARFERTAASSGTFSTIGQTIPMDFDGSTITLTGYIRAENVSDSVALWLREDSKTGAVAFASMQSQGIKGTFDWRQYSISLPWNGLGQTLVFGFFLLGTGTAWVDDMQLLVDGQPIAQAPNRVYTPTPLETDHEFDNGSGIALTKLSETQIHNLATLARVWGFLKYHHPSVTSGQRHWDYELFRILPQVLAAGDAASANGAMAAWIANLGAVPQCVACATLDTSDLALNVNTGWISDASTLGANLSQVLLEIYRNRTPALAQFYVSLTGGAGNPSFDHELSYASLKIPDAGYQLLALFRFWNMVQYFYPNREIMSDQPEKEPEYWNQVLLDFIPRIGLASISWTYAQEMMRFIAKINDTHANLWSSIDLRLPVGTCYLPVDVRFVEGRPIVMRYTHGAFGPASGLRPGDVIQELDGVKVSDLVSQWSPLYADSNQAARLRDIGNYMTRGSCGYTTALVERGGQIVFLAPSRYSQYLLDFSNTYKHDLPGDVFQMLTPEVAYLKLSAVKAADSASYIQSAAGTKGLIIDIRNYPSEVVLATLGSLLVSQPSDFVRFTRGDIANPGAFHWTNTTTLTPQAPHYNGKVVILVDEVTQSHAEYTAMAFRTAPGAWVIGSTTAGADGNVSTVPLPGGLSSYISGIGVFYPDKTPTQRVGIIPDFYVVPTIAGIRAGRDELIDYAIDRILGRPRPDLQRPPAPGSQLSWPLPRGPLPPSSRSPSSP